MKPPAVHDTKSLSVRIVGAPQNAIGVRRGWRSLLGSAVFYVAISGAGLLAADIPTAIFVMTTDGSKVRKVAQVEGYKKHGSPQWSHDGKRLAFDAYEGPANARKFFVINIDGTKLQEMGEHALPHWSPDDKQLAYQNYGDGGGRAGIWVQNVDGRGRNWLADGFCPRWSPDGSRIAFTKTRQGLNVLDLVEGGDHDLLEEPYDNVSGGFDWSPDGKLLAFMGDRNGRRELAIVSAEGASQGLRIRLTGDMSGNVSWSPDGKRLAFSREHQIHLVDAEGDKPPTLIRGQEGSNREPAWSPDGQWIAFSSERTTTGSPSVTVARAAVKLELVRSHDKGGTLYSLAFTPDGRSVLLGGDLTNRRIQVWDPHGGEVVRNIDVRAIFVAVAPDGLRAACAEVPGNAVQYIDLKEGTVIREFAHGSQVLSMEFSGDGTRLISGGLDRTACLFNVETGAESARLKHDMNVGMVAFSADGKLVATACADKKAHLWEAATGKKVREIEHAAVPYSVAFSPDGSQLLTGTGGDLIGPVQGLAITPIDDNSLRLWNVASGKLIREMRGHTHVVFSVTFSPDGKRAVSGSFDRSLRLWDVERGEELSRIEGKGWVTKVVFSSDGTLVLAAGGAQKPFNTRSWTEYPDERVRLFKIVQDDPTAHKR